MAKKTLGMVQYYRLGVGNILSSILWYCIVQSPRLGPALRFEVLPLGTIYSWTPTHEIALGHCQPQSLVSCVVLLFSSCIRNLVSIKVPQGVSELCEISKI